MSAIDQNALRGMKPNRIIPVPPEFRRSCRASERDLIINDIHVNTGCRVLAQWDQSIIYQFEIFGTGAGLEKAIRYINQWISNAHTKSKESTAWAKTPAFDANAWYYEQVEGLELQRKQVFKGPAPESTVRWPDELNDQEVSPRDVFNNKLEALDPIRMHNEVYIDCVRTRSSEWQIEIQAHEMANIEAAEAQLKTMIEKVKTDVMALQNTVNMILDDQEGLKVILERADPWWPNQEDRVVPRLLPSGIMDFPGSFRGELMHFTELSRIQHAFQLALEAVRHRKGAYDLVIRLGCLAIHSKRITENDIGKRYKKEAFLKSIDGSLQLSVKKWFANDASGHQMLKSLCSATKFLEPIKSAGYFGSIPDTLDKTRPVFRGTWVFRDPSMPFGQKPVTSPVVAPPLSLIVVQIDWIYDDDESVYEKNPPRFYRLEQGARNPKEHMDINLLELGESRGWHFALESLNPISPKSVSPVLASFAKGVKMRSDYSFQPNERFADWDATPTVKSHLASGRLDAIYSFGVKDTCYKVELTRMSYPPQKPPVWGLGVRHTEWATYLGELERLPIGRKADWGHTITTFLPDHGQSSYTASGEDGDLQLSNLTLSPDIESPPRKGIRILMEKLLQISAIVSSTMGPAGSVGI
ncbi:uncharacterized protein SETTUDRAFT_96874 [Exserohilum turcica Et28A]|uniref:DUF7905 domain-containing protein n=1 Tax=Exserohilum turcicum (strain 28A) TaxID=671987 RepID=R0K0B4_EXST2|nr:uncharacterized protein SETTUDRAFT_96874 [Exserohilum turcica Et28A]EOA81902.1 hypothetical protein SETTUDRAFT_96874 [Exserohilum turcica Et28A]